MRGMHKVDLLEKKFEETNEEKKKELVQNEITRLQRSFKILFFFNIFKKIFLKKKFLIKKKNDNNQKNFNQKN